MKRAKWLSSDEFANFIAIHARDGGIIHCNACDVSENDAEMTVDHIVPRIDGGDNAGSNLQPLCRSCNSKKGRKPDGYWSKKFYFDGYIDEARLRVSQSDFVMGTITDTDKAEFFSLPYSLINQKFFTFVQNVGAGKTLGMFSLPFALNKVAKPNAPRIDRMLIVTKDSDLRDQIASEIADEPCDFKVVNEKPRVKVLDKSSMLSDDTDDHDIAVMCPHMLWPKIDTNSVGGTQIEWHPFAANVMARYPLICFDESHYAYNNISRLLRIANNSLVFGFTASPVDNQGDLLDDSILMSVYSYDDAQINDGSMKFINCHPDDITVEGDDLYNFNLTHINSIG